jgi:hypothetical protein
MQSMGMGDSTVVGQLAPFEERAVAAGSSFWSSAHAVLGLGFATRLAQRSLKNEIRKRARPELADRLVDLSTGYFQAVRRAAEFAFYDRLLRLWHLLHLPLFFILVATAVVHIIAVHMY